jgi:hypothetical protein
MTRRFGAPKREAITGRPFWCIGVGQRAYYATLSPDKQRQERHRANLDWLALCDALFGWCLVVLRGGLCFVFGLEDGLYVEDDFNFFADQDAACLEDLIPC